MNLYSEGFLDSMRKISDAALTGRCSIIPKGGSNSDPVIGNRGNVIENQELRFDNVPCKLDANANSQVPQNVKANIQDELQLRNLYLSLSDLKDIGYVPESGDIIETPEGNPLGDVVSYRVLTSDNETDELDLMFLVEKL